MHAMLVPIVFLLQSGPPSPRIADADLLRAAGQAAQWLRSCAVRTDIGRIWPADLQDTRAAPSNLYSGGAGVVLFLLEFSRLTGDAAWLDEARDGAAFLASALPESPRGEQCGLYTGVAGAGVALIAAWQRTGDPRFHVAAGRVVAMIADSAGSAGAGIEWGDVTDVIAGGAGIGLFLLHAAAELGRPDCRELASRAGDRLIELAHAEPAGLSWRMDPGFPRVMPNFSHGTAGVSFFLARLYEETGERRFLDPALAGARHLLSIADRRDGGCRIHHHTPGGEDLYYLGWCHGPAGTARLFVQLARVTGDSEWMAWAHRAATGVLDSGIPEQRTPGFWDNVGPCCGSAGVAEFFAEMHLASGRADYLAFAERMAADVVSRATRTDAGCFWVQAEHRVRPEFRVAQTGAMQGAAGIGLALLRVHEARSGRAVMRLPDSPFRGGAR